MSNTEIIERTLHNSGYGTYANYAGPAARLLPASGVTPMNVQSAARQVAGREIPFHLARSIADAINAQDSTGPVAVEEFDRAHAAEVIREAALRLAGGDRRIMEQVEPVLVEAGLVDAPEPEPESESGLRRTVDRLVEFARRHGFSG